ncbi:MAG TPA: GNAT family N-acetyltransferase [Rhizomicrobium sp.]|nr:GNAT family N-acetyltransferase [Rhizomicrobium sp.]
MQPEGCWDWFQILAETTLSAGEKACVMTLADDAGQPVCAIPVVTIGGRVIRGLTSPFTTLFAAPLGAEENARRLGRLVAAKAGATLRLDGLADRDSSSRAFEKGLAEGGLAVVRFRHFANWFERIDDFAHYWDRRDSQLKATVKRKSAALARDGRLAFALVPADWREGAQIYQAIYAKSWKPAEPHPHFISALLERLGPQGLVRLGIARVDGQPAAAQIWLVRDSRATIFKLAHDPAFDRQSVGTLLTHWMLQQLHDTDGVREVDFGRGDDRYKRQWLAARREREGLLAANPRSLKGLAAILFDILPSRLARYLRRNGSPVLVFRNFPTAMGFENRRL